MTESKCNSDPSSLEADRDNAIKIAQVNAANTYRMNLVQLRTSMEAQYDKAVLSLSGGAFGISGLIVKEFMALEGVLNSPHLVAAWVSWSISLASALFSFASSAHAMGAVIAQIDRDGVLTTANGGLSDALTKVLNAISGLGFVAGLGFFTAFISIHPST